MMMMMVMVMEVVLGVDCSCRFQQEEFPLVGSFGRSREAAALLEIDERLSGKRTCMQVILQRPV